MLRSSRYVVALLLMTACDSEVLLESESDEPVVQPEARVDDCERVGDGVALARLSGSGDPGSLATDGESLFFLSEGQLFSLPLTEGDAEPLTDEGASGSDVKYSDGFVYWLNGDTVYRVATSGGEPEALIELAVGAAWAVAGDAILSTNGSTEPPSIVFRSSLTTGEISEMVTAEEGDVIRRLHVEGDRVLVASDHKLLRLSVFGGDEQLLAEGTLSSWEGPAVFDEQVYFGAHDKADFYLARVPQDGSETFERVVSGYVVSTAFDDEAVYVYAIPSPLTGSEPTTAELLRVPLDGGPSQRLSALPSEASVGFVIRSAGLVVDEDFAYFIDECTDTKGAEFRVVAIAKQP